MPRPLVCVIAFVPWVLSDDKPLNAPRLVMYDPLCISSLFCLSFVSFLSDGHLLNFEFAMEFQVPFYKHQSFKQAPWITVMLLSSIWKYLR